MLDKCFIQTKELHIFTCSIYNGQNIKVISKHLNSIYLPFILQEWFVVLINYEDKAQIKLKVKHPLIQCKN